MKKISPYFIYPIIWICISVSFRIVITTPSIGLFETINEIKKYGMVSYIVYMSLLTWVVFLPEFVIAGIFH